MSKSDESKNSRRRFLKQAAAGTLAAGAANVITGRADGAPKLFTLEPEPEPAKQVSANDRIRLGLIGAGGMGNGDLETALRVKGVEFVAAADVYDGRLTYIKEVYGNNVFTTRDYREVLARPDIDAVIVATPDHWHSQITIDAFKAGKDVYCEKPVVQRVDEGAAVIDAQEKHKRITQVGSQFVSSIIYKKAKDLMQSGVIGELNLVDGSMSRRSAVSAWQYPIPPDASPQTIDWDRFLGRAPKVPFDAKRIFRWRNYQDYGTGIGGDLFVHQFTSMHFVTNSKGPSRVYATGGLRYWKDGRDVPDVLLGMLDYPKTAEHPAFNVSLRVSFVDGGLDRAGWGTPWIYRFVGSEGVIELDGNGVTLRRGATDKNPDPPDGPFPKAVREQLMKEYREKYPPREAAMTKSDDERYVAPAGYRERLDHFRNFFDAMRTRKQAAEDAVVGFRAAAPALLANISYFENRVVEWDPETMKLKSVARR
jgi:predicted dehydrogenase